MTATDAMSADSRPMTVGELSRRIQRLLETGIGEVRATGEVSNVRLPRSGHCYFLLKDSEAAINAVCFRSSLARCGFTPIDGMQVEVRGRVTAYTPRSEYQIIVTSMRKAGLGDLMLRFEQLKQKLRAEGLFDQERKRPIPRVPRRIGIVTSATGAALRDMLNVLGRRARGLELWLAPAAVQGDTAPLEIVRAIERLARHGQVEVIVVGRGGGSIEDLWAFNDERVVRAIAASPIPVISAVGHETDTTLSDYAADLRAPTPSAAAELVCAHHAELNERLTMLGGRLARATRHRLQLAGQRLERSRASWGMRRPVDRCLLAGQRLDEMREQLSSSLQQCLRDQRTRLRHLDGRLRLAEPMRRLRLMDQRLQHVRGLLHAAGPARWRPRLLHARSIVDQLAARRNTAVTTQLERKTTRLQALADRLHASSPTAILQRGYSIVTHGGRGRVVTDPARLRTGEVVRVRSAGGEWSAAVLPLGGDLFEGIQ